MTTPIDPIFPALSGISQHFSNTFITGEQFSPAEAMIVEAATPKRRADFNTGRYCARKALARFIAHEPEILQGKGREPLWPTGIVGSISHSPKLAGAVVALKSDISAIGMDIETIGGVKPDMWYLLFNDAEQALLLNKRDDANLWATLLFSLKESFYKLQYPLTRLFLDFRDIMISENEGRLCFLQLNADLDLSAISFSDVETHWTITGDQLIALCYIPNK